MKKIGKILWNVFTTVVVAVVVLVAIALAGARLIGFTPYAILSPSMMPVYQVGDLVYVQQVDDADISEGDVITFVADEDLTLVTHRVAGIDTEQGCLYTKGDANNTVDTAPVLYENVVGVVKFSIPKLGFVSTYLRSESGKFVAIAIVATLILLFLLPELFRKDNKKEDVDNAGDSLIYPKEDEKEETK